LNKARDAFYSCIENECDKKPTEIATVGLLYPKECQRSRDQFVKQCRSSWVTNLTLYIPFLRFHLAIVKIDNLFGSAVRKIDFVKLIMPMFGISLCSCLVPHYAHVWYFSITVGIPESSYDFVEVM